MTRKCLLAVFVFALLLSQTPCLADDFHYNNILIGERAAGMAGAYTAVSDDPSGMYYNPAGIVEAGTRNLSLSVNAYSTVDKEYKEVVGGRHWKRHSSSLLPNFFGILQEVGKLKVGISYAVPDNISEEQDDTFTNFPLGGSQVDRYIINFNNHDKTYNVGPSIAFPLTDKLSLGLTLYGHYRSSDTVDNQTLVFSDSQSQWMNTLVRTEEWGVRPILGLMWSPAEKVSLGLALSRTFVISSKTRVQFTQKDLNGNLEMFNPPDSGDKKEYPYRISVGAAYFPSPKLLISADLTYFTGVEYSILTMKTRKEPVLNGALGAEYYFTRNWALRGGLFSNRSNSPEVKGTANEQTEKIDAYGVTLSLTRFIKNTSFTAGGSYSYGSGKAQITSTPGSVDATYQSWTIFVASSYSF